MGTYALYKDTPNGRLRVGTVRGASCYDAAQRLHRRHPNLLQDGAQHFLAPRVRMMGRYVDGELLPLDAPTPRS